MRLLLPILLALVLVPAALSAGPRVQTITGAISANSGASITVTSGDRSLTCRVLGAKAQAALARWGVGVRAAMACTRDGDRLLLSRLTRLGSKEGTSTTPTTTTAPTSTTPTTTTAPPATPAPIQTRRDARGKISALGAGTITVTRDGGTSLTCSVTDGQAQSIAQGAPVGTAVLIVCTGEGDHPTLLSLQKLETSTAPPTTTTPPPTTTPSPTTTNTERREVRGVVIALSSQGVTVKPDAGGDSLRCRITPAADSTAAAAKLSLGAHVGIVCRRDGDGYVLSGATPIS
ncbi:MAG TPA: hypothetical protein VIL98_08475 [Gaiellaceae bacterium]